MNEAFKKMLAKKKGSGDGMSSGRQKARGSVLDDLMGNMDSRDGQKLGMKKVSVMAPSEEGLEEGLNKAKEVVDGLPESEEMPEDESIESPEDQTMESSEDHSDKSPEQLMEEIRQLKAALAAKA